MKAGKATLTNIPRPPPNTPRTPHTPCTTSEPVQLADHEARLASDRRAWFARTFPDAALPTQSECRPLFRYLKGQCPVDEPDLPDAAAGKAMLRYCMDKYGSLHLLRHMMDEAPFTLKLKLLDYGDGSAAVLDELARWNIPCDVEAHIGGKHPGVEKDLAKFLGDTSCNV